MGEKSEPQYVLVPVQEVDHYLRAGWLPWGSPIVHTDRGPMQAMVAEKVMDRLIDALVPRFTNIFKKLR